MGEHTGRHALEQRLGRLETHAHRLAQQLATVTAERDAKLAPVVLALKRLVWDMESSPYVKARQFTGGLEQAHQALSSLPKN